MQKERTSWNYSPKHFKCIICNKDILCLNHKSTIESFDHEDYPKYVITYWNIEQSGKIVRLPYHFYTHVCSEQCYKYNKFMNALLDEYFITNKCLVCDKDTTVLCSRCETINYCSIECQRQDYEIHRNYCFTTPIKY